MTLKQSPFDMQSRLEDILESAGLGAWDWCLVNNDLRFDRRWFEMLGLDPKSTPHDLATWDNRVHPDDRAQAYEDILNCVEGRSITYENIHRLRHEDGYWVWILDRGRITEKDEKGNPTRFTGTHLDISKIMDLKSLSHTLQRMAHIGGWEVEVQTERITWSEEVYRICAVPSTFIPTLEDVFKFYPEHERARLKECIQGCIAGKYFSETFEIVDASGKNKWVESAGEPVFDSAGKVYKIRGTFQDVTRRMETERLFQQAQVVAKIGSWSFDARNGDISWSDQMYSLFNECKADGPPSFEAHVATIYMEDRDLWRQTVDECLREGRPYKMRFRSVLPDRIVWIESYGEAVRTVDGSIYGLKGTCQDVTELVQAENQVREERVKTIHSVKLASLGEMSAGIAHEVNNPLAVIMGNLQVIRKYLDQPQKALAKIEVMEKACGRIAKIIMGLKKFSRSSDRRCHSVHSLSKIAEEALMLTNLKATRFAIPIQLHLRGEARVICDDMEIEQVIVNLVNNSIDAIRDAEDRWIEVTVGQSEEHVFLQVRDAGRLVADEVKRKMFDPFYTTKPVGEGTGLGLSITRGILQDHKAQIELVESDPHTCFYIRFPRLEAELHAF